MIGALLVGEADNLLAGITEKLAGASVDVHECKPELAGPQLTAWDMDQRPVDRIVFGPVTVCHDLPQTTDDVERLVEVHETALLSFLTQLQAAGRLLARRGGGQIWVVTQDQSARYLMPLQTSPVDTMARRAAVKSFAREVRRLDVAVNCLKVQVTPQQETSGVGRILRGNWSVYASRFSAYPSASFTDFFFNLLNQDNLPMSGLVVPVGLGLVEQDI